MTDAEWLRMRKMYICSSDIPDLLRVGFNSPEAAYRSKVFGEETQPTLRMRGGAHLEEFVARLYEERFSCKLHAPPERLMPHPDPDNRVAASIDRLAFTDRGTKIVEIKIRWGQRKGAWEDGVKEAYVHQANHQMGVAAAALPEPPKFVDIAVFFAPYEFFVYADIPFDAPRFDRTCIIANDFMKLVDKGIASPETKFDSSWDHPLSDSVRSVSKGLDAGKEIILSRDDAKTAADWLAAKEAKASEQKLRAKILAAMGNAERGHLPDGRIAIRTLVNRKGVSYPKLKIIGSQGEECDESDDDF
jgi:hypothetical protein